MPLRPLLALAALAAACALPTASTAAGPSRTTKSVCGYSGYSYAGFQSPSVAYGISGHVTAVSAPQVQAGHVAAWIGVGGAGMGLNGEDEWLQAGIAGFPDGHSELYYEYALPGDSDATYVALSRVKPGEGHDLAVQERPTQPGTWRVVLDGHKVSPPITLPGSHGSWRPIATAETWDGGVRGCNRYSYDFTSLAVATTFVGGWQPFQLSRRIQDPGYLVQPRVSAFAASTQP